MGYTRYNKKEQGGLKSAIRVVAGQTFPAPTNTVIWCVEPDPSFTGKAIAANAGDYAMTSDRTNTGVDVSGVLTRFMGRYSSVSCTAGACFVYLDSAT